jgi:KDO2-lipid IV(A) lauroyltransferase
MLPQLATYTDRQRLDLTAGAGLRVVLVAVALTRAGRFLTPLFAHIAYDLFRHQRRQIVQNLTAAFPCSPSGWKEKTAQACFRHFAASSWELVEVATRMKSQRPTVTWLQPSHFKQALGVGRGVVVVSAHYGNYCLLPMALALDAPVVGMVMKPSQRSRTSLIGAFRWFVRSSCLPAMGAQVLETNGSAWKAAQEMLGHGGVVIILADLPFGSRTVATRLLGVPHAIPTGAAALARLSGVPLLPVVIRRSADSTHEVLSLPPYSNAGRVHHTAERQRTADDCEVMESCLRFFERQILTAPEQWLWFHRAWNEPVGIGAMTAARTSPPLSSSSTRQKL